MKRPGSGTRSSAARLGNWGCGRSDGVLRPDSGPRRSGQGFRHLAPCGAPPGRLSSGIMSDVTRILDAIAQGDPQAASQLLPLVYDELRRLAAQRLSHEEPGQTLDATALVHEAYLRLVGRDAARAWDGRGHFFAAAARAMRRILIENARRKGREKHGGGGRRGAGGRRDPHAPLKAGLVELRYFGGLPLEEPAPCLGISPSTADRAWRYARAWLYAAM